MTAYVTGGVLLFTTQGSCAYLQGFVPTQDGLCLYICFAGTAGWAAGVLAKLELLPACSEPAMTHAAGCLSGSPQEL